MRKLLDASGPRTLVLVRLLVGWVFIAEGVQKFIFADELGAGRFAKIGIPWPAFTGPFVGLAETLCGVLVIAGFLTRFAALVLLIDISMAIISTKLPILLGHEVGPFSLPKMARYGMWSALHEARTDASMWIGSLYLIIVGAGRWSLDALLGWTQADDRSPRE